VKNDVVICVDRITKTYPVFKHPWQAVCYLTSLIRHGKPRAHHLRHGVAALRSVSFNVQRGERIGIIGRNGAGKSTLLKLLAGDFTPTDGSLHIKGKVYCLLPGAINFSPEQSTLENARRYLSYLPLSPDELAAKIDDIKTFTELEEYFTQPVRNLSLGMRMRAEFAIATAYMADVVIIDEVLGAGDIYWSEKIARRMEKLCANGTTLILVSHSLQQINRYCHRAMWIEQGEIVMDGPVIEVTKHYEGFLERLSWQTDDLDDKTISVHQLATETDNQQLPGSGQLVTRWPGRGDVLITGVWFNDEAVSDLSLTVDSALSIRFQMQAKKSDQYRVRYLFTLWNSHGKRFAVFENDADVMALAAGEIRSIDVDLPSIGLSDGIFDISLTLSNVSDESTTNEKVTRLDSLYKSFRIQIKRTSPHPLPTFCLPLTAQRCRSYVA